jgi:proline iminopeptidase
VLDVGDGQHLYWEVHGNPAGIPVVCLHGGPGGGGRRGNRKMFDPNLFRVTLFDQRGCGESLPNVADPAVALDANTTWHLVDDIERLRIQAGVDRWLVYGGSWGSTLALAYAQRHPHRVSGLLLVAVYRGAGRLFPEAWDAFRAGAGDIGDSSAELIAAYGGLISSPDPRVRERAAYDWCTWEDALIAHESSGSPGSYSSRTGLDRIAFVRLCAHYFGTRRG